MEAFAQRTKVPATKQKDSLRALYHGSLSTAVADLGDNPYVTPLSMAGPGCSGSWAAAAKVNYEVTSGPVRTRLGRLAFATLPWARGSVGGARGDPRRFTDGTGAQRAIRYAQAGRCPLCDPDGARTTDDGPWHITLECPHEAVAAVRAECAAAAGRVVGDIVASVAAAQRRAAGPTAAAATAARGQNIQELLSSADWSSADCKHALFHLLVAVPWPASVAPVGVAPLSHAIGGLFDSVRTLPRHELHSVPTLAIAWAGHWIKRFAVVRWGLLEEIQRLNGIASL